jgi:hypothetical protein
MRYDRKYTWQIGDTIVYFGWMVAVAGILGDE